MEGLLCICNYLGSKNCHPDIRKFRNIREIKPGKKFHMLPVGEKVKELDEICKKCKFRLFEIKIQKCPACDNVDIKLTSIIDIDSQFGSLKGNLYKCNKCNTKLLSDKIF